MAITATAAREGLNRRAEFTDFNMKQITQRDMLCYRASFQAQVIRECKKGIARDEAVMIEAKRKFREIQQQISQYDKENK